MTDNDNSGNPPAPDRDRRKKMRRLGKERRDQPRWDTDSPIRRKSPGRRALDRLKSALDFIKK
ncbi:hypothetical protein SCL_1334 [Sulfuricaulis limicola]|uniref:Uncharacterized protein n=1 Tax=Sulfuricaulis limicola TaxID=1620215 RepID=A0A1B4XFR4_9GAMM|nr:hypothetical protein [Sulfuricaulis limicola]BAV33645.1 hypothetical protein SCL_1334 [Sulfuricaulis limicola]